MFDAKPFTGSFEESCQEKSVPHMLLALVVSMVLEGPSIKDQLQIRDDECSTPAILSIAQILKYNRVALPQVVGAGSRQNTNHIGPHLRSIQDLL